MASILVFGNDGLSPLLILGSSNYMEKEKKDLLIGRARDDLKAAGLIVEENRMRIKALKNYGNCAETTQWLILK